MYFGEIAQKKVIKEE